MNPNQIAYIAAAGLTALAALKLLLAMLSVRVGIPGSVQDLALVAIAIFLLAGKS